MSYFLDYQAVARQNRNKKNVAQKPMAFKSHRLFLSCSKQFKLLGGARPVRRFGAVEVFHHAVLPISDVKNDDFSFWWQESFHPLGMDLGILPAGAVPGVDAVLHHGKAILYQRLAKLGVILALFFGLYREVEENEYPHNSVLVVPEVHGFRWLGWSEGHGSLVL
jgi:hypothetical protein